MLYRYTPDRKGRRPREHLKDFSGFLQADGYAGFDKLYVKGVDGTARITEVACWAHVRRKFHDIYKATKGVKGGRPDGEQKTSASALAREALEQIGALYDIERDIRGRPPEERARVRREKALPVLDAFGDWCDRTLTRVSGKLALAGAIRYARSRWAALVRYTGDGRLEIDNNAAERAIRGVALGRKNWLFAGSDAGGERAARIYSLIETCKLNAIDPQAYLADILARIADHPVNRVCELLPWNWAQEQKPEAAEAA